MRELPKLAMTAHLAPLRRSEERAVVTVSNDVDAAQASGWLELWATRDDVRTPGARRVLFFTLAAAFASLSAWSALLDAAKEAAKEAATAEAKKGDDRVKDLSKSKKKESHNKAPSPKAHKAPSPQAAPSPKGGRKAPSSQAAASSNASSASPAAKLSRPSDETVAQADFDGAVEMKAASSRNEDNDDEDDESDEAIGGARMRKAATVVDEEAGEVESSKQALSRNDDDVDMPMLRQKEASEAHEERREKHKSRKSMIKKPAGAPRVGRVTSLTRRRLQRRPHASEPTLRRRRATSSSIASPLPRRRPTPSCRAAPPSTITAACRHHRATTRRYCASSRLRLRPNPRRALRACRRFRFDVVSA